MKFNKWTMGLAALGVVSLASAVKAEEKQNFLQTALSSTTISGYVDTSLEWQIKPDDSNSALPIPFRGTNKRDGFNLNVVKLSLEKPLDESEWASGYKVDLLFGPDAVNYNTSVGTGAAPSDFAIQQAYVALRAPVGNGIEFKVGTFTTIIGYEVFESGNNPNFSRSWGWAAEPTQHTGVLGMYRVNDCLSMAGGVANTLSPGINNRSGVGTAADGNFWSKTWLGSVALTAPQSWGWAAGSALYGGVISGWGGSGNQDNYYAGLTLNTPVAGLKAGIAYDRITDLGGVDGRKGDILGLYASFQATPKLSLHARAECVWADDPSTSTDDATVKSLTGTVQYDLWQNVISRLELRWDELNNTAADNSSLALYANIIYKF